MRWAVVFCSHAARDAAGALSELLVSALDALGAREAVAALDVATLQHRADEAVGSVAAFEAAMAAGDHAAALAEVERAPAEARLWSPAVLARFAALPGDVQARAPAPPHLVCVRGPPPSPVGGPLLTPPGGRAGIASGS